MTSKLDIFGIGVSIISNADSIANNTTSDSLSKLNTELQAAASLAAGANAITGLFGAGAAYSAASAALTIQVVKLGQDYNALGEGKNYIDLAGDVVGILGDLAIIGGAVSSAVPGLEEFGPVFSGVGSLSSIASVGLTDQSGLMKIINDSIDAVSSATSPIINDIGDALNAAQNLIASVYSAATQASDIASAVSDFISSLDKPLAAAAGTLGIESVFVTMPEDGVTQTSWVNASGNTFTDTSAVSTSNTQIITLPEPDGTTEVRIVIAPVTTTVDLPTFDPSQVSNDGLGRFNFGSSLADAGGLSNQIGVSGSFGLSGLTVTNPTTGQTSTIQLDNGSSTTVQEGRSAATGMPNEQVTTTGSNGQKTDSVFGQDASVPAGAAEFVALVGNGTTADIGGSTTVALNASNQTVTLDNQGSTVNVAAGQQYEAIYGSGTTVDLVANSGSSVGVHGTGNVVNNNDGNDVTQLDGQNTSATVNGDGTVNLTSSNQAVSVSGSTVYIADNVSGVVINARDETVYEGHNDDVTVYGAYLDICGDSSDTNSGAHSGFTESGTSSSNSSGGSDDFASVAKALSLKTTAPFTSTGRAATSDATSSLGVGTTTPDAATSQTAAFAADRGLIQAQLAAQSTGLVGAATTAVFAGHKWTTDSTIGNPTITWSFAASPGSAQSSFSGYLDDQYKATVEQAMKAWEAVAGITFNEVSDSVTSDIRIGWGDFDTTDNGILGLTDWKQQSGALQAGTIIRLEDPSETALALNGDGQLAYDGTQATLYQVVLHEIGHALGLADDADPNSVMFTASSATNRMLDQTDINGIQALYGKPTVQPLSPTVSPDLTASANSNFDVATAIGISSINKMIQSMASFTPHLSATLPAAIVPQNMALEQTLAAPLHH